jgi:hypothetical protein
MFHVEHGISLHWSDRRHESQARENRLQLLLTDPISRCGHGSLPQTATPQRYVPRGTRAHPSYSLGFHRRVSGAGLAVVVHCNFDERGSFRVQ